ncbi:MAG: type I methionyl aminopeptidase [Patescibacteria group bacterium]|nr:type I methionyl aminopeptidase [Patescibacteria group bacterium]MBU1160729.1 type I methionyl aminopeptidase [Patescibacteria group bacterium]MBU1350163.1 type I methionyl aminopeptidase [Patescibacteria group bacterium]MBU1421490.1 type I methionyl aminopeptidase [Patescibacteria group bacterium]MBU1684413.1 type I methionyl aminopeptidase [Patescibacteria group bacterium]
MVTIKSQQEIEIMREGGRILAGILDEICRAIKPGITTDELEKMACDLIKKAGGSPSFKGYKMHDGEIFPTALCTSINNEVVHAPALPSRKLNSGDIIDIDIGYRTSDIGSQKLNNKYYNSKSDIRNLTSGFYLDMSRTVAVGKISKQARRLINVTKKSLELAIKQVKPGNTLNDIGGAVQDFVESQGFSVVRELVGHGVGYKVHEDPKVPNYKITDKSLKNIILQPGMVLAIEPMVNIGGWRVKTAPDGFTSITSDKSLSAHFEHTVAVVDEGCKVLTHNA